MRGIPQGIVLPRKVQVLNGGLREFELLVKMERVVSGWVRKPGESSLPSLVDRVAEVAEQGKKPEVKQQEELEVNNESL
jgi:hypothetical protein